MAIYAYTLKIVEKDPLLRLQMSAKEKLNRHQFFPTHKQYVKIKLMQNGTKWDKSVEYLFGKDEILVKL